MPIPTAKQPTKEPLRTEHYQADPRSLLMLAGRQNARYMTAEQINRLAANLKHDGVLTSSILVFRPRPENTQFFRPDNDRAVVLSGNHRNEASIMAGLPTVPVIEILSPLTDEQATAIQLSHNAIEGQDDASVLLELYERLDLNEKLYSGVTDDAFKVEELDLSGMGIGNPTYQEISLLFLPSEAEEFVELVKRLTKTTKRPLTLAADLSDFEHLFDSIIRVKESLNVYNSALAFRMMATLAIERLDQMELEKQPTQSEERPAA